MGFSALALEILLLNLRAWQLRAPLRLNERERLMTRDELIGWSIPLCIGLTALLLALVLPPGWIGWSGWIYFSMAILIPLRRRRQGRKLAAL